MTQMGLHSGKRIAPEGQPENVLEETPEELAQDVDSAA